MPYIICGLLIITLTLSGCGNPAFEQGLGAPEESTPQSGYENVNSDPPMLTNIRISWDVPEFRENGDKLAFSDIAGYEIVFRKTDEDYYNRLLMEDDNTPRVSLENIPIGEYEFLIAVYDTDGLYGAYSDPVIATFSESL